MPGARTRADFETDAEWNDWYLAAMIHRRSSVVIATGWTFRELDDQDSAEVQGLLLYVNKKAGLEAEARSLTPRG